MAVLWPCTWTDDDGQVCVLQARHPGEHQDSGLRAWLEATTDDSVVRTYTGPNANDVFQMEARLFARFGFYPVSQGVSTSRTRPTGADVLTVGLLAYAMQQTSTTISVAFRRERAAAAPDLMTALRQLRDAGVLTKQEFEAKALLLAHRS